MASEIYENKPIYSKTNSVEKNLPSFVTLQMPISTILSDPKLNSLYMEIKSMEYDVKERCFWDERYLFEHNNVFRQVTNSNFPHHILTMTHI